MARADRGIANVLAAATCVAVLSTCSRSLVGRDPAGGAGDAGERTGAGAKRASRDTDKAPAGSTAGETTTSRDPSQASTANAGGSLPFVQVSASTGSTCAVRANGSIECWGMECEPDECVEDECEPAKCWGMPCDEFTVCWGRTCDGKAGCRTFGGSGELPPYEFYGPPRGAFEQVYVGGLRSKCGIRTGGTVECWGADDLRFPRWPPDLRFLDIPRNDAEFVNPACGILRDGTLWCQGSSPPPPANGHRYTKITGGLVHQCALRDDGVVQCWGCGGSILGEFPTRCDVPSGRFVQIDAGDYHTCGVRDDGTVACWDTGTTRGDCILSNECGQALPPEGRFREVSAGDSTTCGVRDDSTLTCWGSGATTSDDCVNDPWARECGQADPPSGVFAHVSVGTLHACALTPEGAIACWGRGRTLAYCDAAASDDYYFECGESLPPEPHP